jgi:tetratricopeptide (TPR) repeat protein
VNALPYRMRRVCIVCAVFALVMCSVLLHVSAVMAQDGAHDRAHGHVHRAAQKPEKGRTAAAVTDPRTNSASMPERAALLQLAEAALQRGDSAAAIDHFDRAAMLLHAPDTEMGLVRAYMQAGEYRRALAFCAHTAGAHREAAAPGALYAWLLQAGGQNEFAKRTLAEALGRHPVDAVLLQAQTALVSAQPITDALLLNGPHRLAPFAAMQADQADVPRAARVVASGVLLASGQRAVLPLHAVPAGSSVWLRNGLGHTSQAVVAQRLDTLGLAVLSLTAALPIAEKNLMPAATQDPFAGSPGYVVTHSPSLSNQAAWPWLHAGFHGPATPSGDRLLGIAVPAESGGGLVLDAAGRWAGVALTDPHGRALLVPVSALRAALPATDFSEAPPLAVGAASSRMTADLAYERALRFSLQVMALQP